MTTVQIFHFVAIVSVLRVEQYAICHIWFEQWLDIEQQLQRLILVCCIVT